jgi:pilus assembly protein Flp/PilA
MPLIARFLTDESGTTAIEYALIAAGISIVIIAAVQSLGVNVTALFTKVADALV